ncbi:transcriptional regulator [Brevundimonas sp.]|uniref:winged helix-turn-helix domain-containing protein n=1 Tax=Brevundimonas sp. TaxID=1871086 RepID=UPI0035614EAE
MKTVASIYSFDRFVLDPAERRLSQDGRRVELSGRYLDALVLLVVEEGRLVTKARFLDEVWKGVPVTEEALTQCVRSLRKALGDQAGRPRFIETVPGHGYRFIASVTRQDVGPTARAVASGHLQKPGQTQAMAHILAMGRAGLIGGGLAGLVGGLAYGFAGVADGGAGGAASGLLVLATLTAVVGMLGGSSVGFGVGAAGFVVPQRGWLRVVGGAGGGLAVGALVRLVGLDAFVLLFGSAPKSITGAGEGMLLGASIGAGFWISQLNARRRYGVLAGAGLTGLAGAGATLVGGQLMGGSLTALAAQFPEARLRLDHIGALFGEATFGPVSQAMTAGLEGALFGAAMVWALTTVRAD